ncbi:Hypothetical protein A7982_11991 [Minicystis rosea]|nr:Hypothetical protein A7982_11991 [Minicystis rosea]
MATARNEACAEHEGIATSVDEVAMSRLLRADAASSMGL